MITKGIELVAPINAMLDAIASRMDPIDVAELAASLGCSPREGLRLSLDLSQDCRGAVRDGVPLAVFGCAYAGPGLGSPWMLSTVDCHPFRRELMRINRQCIATWRSHYSTLGALIDARNVRSIRWLESLGFSMTGRVERFGAAQVPFCRYELQTTKTRKVKR